MHGSGDGARNDDDDDDDEGTIMGAETHLLDTKYSRVTPE